MRIAPLAFLLDPDVEAERTALRDVCRITHHHDEAYVGALAVAVAIRLASQSGYDTASLPIDVAGRLPDSQVRDRLTRFATFSDDISPFQVGDTWGSSGFVADSVPLAIFAARDIGRRTFADVVQRAIEAGGDTDTIGSITAQIAGASIGLGALPADLVSRLRDRDEIVKTAEQFGQTLISSRR